MLNTSTTEPFSSNLSEKMPDSAQAVLDLIPEAPPRATPKLTLAPPVAEAPQAPAQVAVPPKRPSILRRIVLSAIVLAALAGAAKYGHEWYVLGRFQISTDDAYVKTDMSQLGTKVAGYVTDIPAAENTAVKKGDVVLKLDAGDYKLAVDAELARIETQKSVIAGFTSQVDAQNAQIAAAEARLTRAQAEEKNAAADMERSTKLANQKIASIQTLDDATLRHDTALAAISEAQAGVLAAKAQINVIAANRVEAERSLDEMNTALTKVNRDLSFTEIRAPFDGIVANRAVEPGQFVQAGTRLMALLPADGTYIEANFKETQIADLHDGQKALIKVDAIDGKTYEGEVISLSPASGAEFSLLPPENATGNFTKITQRVPVKISVPAELADTLKSGLSVTVTLDTRDTGTAAK
jgi:membrane fusion protein, multidrug efflux system